MKDKTTLPVESLEAKLPRWEKWLWACFGAAIMMLIQAAIKYHEDITLVGLLYSLEREIPNIWQIVSFPKALCLSLFFVSPWRLALWVIVETAALAPAAILGLHSHWRRVALAKRLDLIGGYLLAGWVALLAIGGPELFEASRGYGTVIFLSIAVLGAGYLWLRRKKDKAEEIFP